MDYEVPSLKQHLLFYGNTNARNFLRVSSMVVSCAVGEKQLFFSWSWPTIPLWLLG
jgi:hypothetical protein